MGSGTRLAFGILITTTALAMFYFAFHHGGVVNPDGTSVSNPSEAIQWLVSEFHNATSGSNSSATNSETPSQEQSAAAATAQAVTNPNAVLGQVLPTPTGLPSINTQLTGG